MALLPSVANEQLPTPRPALGVARITPVDTSSVAAIEAEGGAALRAGARDLGSGSAALLAAVRKEEDALDRVAVDRATNAARREQMRLTQEVLNTRGEDAMKGKLFSTYGEKFRGSHATIAAGLENDRQREAFARRAEVLDLQFGGDILNHVRGETDATVKATYVETVELNTEAAIAGHADQGAIDLALLNIDKATEAIADRDGWPPEQLASVRKQQASEVHVGVIEHKLVADPAGAKVYYRANKDAVLGSERGRLEEAIKIGDVQRQAYNDVDSIMSGFDPNSDDMVAQQRAALAKARRYLDPIRRKAAVDGVKMRIGEVDALRDEQTQQYVDQGYAAALKGEAPSPVVLEHLRRRSPADYRGVMALRTSGEPAASNPETEARLWSAYRAAAKAGPGSPEARAFLGRNITQDYWKLTVADRRFWEAQQAGLDISLDTADAKRAEEARRTRAVSQSYSTVRGAIDNQLRASGIDPNVTAGDTGAVKLNSFENRLFAEVEAWHFSHPGQKMPEPAAQEITRGLLEVAVEDGWWPVMFGGQAEMREYEVGTALDEIPKAEQAKIRADIIAEGDVPTPGLMLHLWRTRPEAP